jgi:hypothetical protein
MLHFLVLYIIFLEKRSAKCKSEPTHSVLQKLDPSAFLCLWPLDPVSFQDVELGQDHKVVLMYPDILALHVFHSLVLCPLLRHKDKKLMIIPKGMPTG